MINYKSGALALLSDKGVGAEIVFIPFDTFPATYLKHDVKIIDGNGTESQPFVLSLN